MSFSIVDNLGNVLTNKRNGQPLSGLPNTKRSAVEEKFKDKIASGEIRIITSQSPEERDEFAKEKLGLPGQILAAQYPNTTENIMDGNKSLGQYAKGIVKDVATAVPRSIVGAADYYTTPSNKHDQTFLQSVGTRQEDVKLDDPDTGGNFHAAERARKFVTSPEFSIGVATAPLSDVGYLLTKAPTASKAFGAVGGAAYGVAMELASKFLNDEPISDNDIESAAVVGGAGEVALQIVRAAITKIGKEQVKEIAGKAWLGGSSNTKLRDDQFDQFIADPQNAETLALALSNIKVKNKLLSLFGRDSQGNKLERLAIDEAKKFKLVFPTENKNFKPSSYEGKTLGGKFLKERRDAIVGDIDNPEYAVAPGYRLTSESERKKTPTFEETNANRFAGHTSHVRRLNEALQKTNDGPMTQGERDALAWLSNELSKNYNKAKNADGFALENELDNGGFTSYLRGQKSVSKEFKDELDQLAKEYEQKAFDLESYTAKNFADKRAQLNDHIVDDVEGSGYLVRKDYVKANEKLKDDINGLIRGLAGKTQQDAGRRLYSAKEGSVGSKVYKDFLDTIQTKLRNKQHLDADDFSEIYFNAARFNFVDVMRFMEDYAKRLGVSDAEIQLLRKNGRVPGQLFKLREGIRNESSAKGNMLERAADFFDPRGVNSLGVKAANYAERNYNIGSWSNPSSSPKVNRTVSTSAKVPLMLLGTDAYKEYNLGK